jgi:hypothetical protein
MFVGSSYLFDNSTELSYRGSPHMHTHITSLKSAIFISKQLTVHALLNKRQFHRSGDITYILLIITTDDIVAAN